MDIQKITKYIETIETLCEKVRVEIGSDKPVVSVRTSQEGCGVSVRQNGKIKLGEEREFSRGAPTVVRKAQTLDLASRIINDPNWPVAVHQDLLCEPTESDLNARAEGILDIMIDSNPADKRFLDFGCGLGHTTRKMLERGVSKAIGYDPKMNPEIWDAFQEPRLCFTNDINNAGERFDIIMAYDVLDHCERPVESLRRLHKLLTPNGVLYVRCHPWSSRTGGHMYHQINKAYIHLAVDDDILIRLGHKVEPIKKIRRPLSTYKEWFMTTSFNIRCENKTSETLENFFKEDPIANDSILRHWDGDRARDHSLTTAKIFDILETHFVDFCLQKL